MTTARPRPDDQPRPAAGPTAGPAAVTARYVIRVRGHLDEHWTTGLGGLARTLDADGTTTLSGPLPDQAALHGVLAVLRDIGAHLLEVRATDATR